MHKTIHHRSLIYFYRTLIFTTPFSMFVVYIGMYCFFENILGISITSVESSDLFFDRSFQNVKETIFRAAWGISLIISSVISAYLLCFCAINIVKLSANNTLHRLLLLVVFVSSMILFRYIYYQDLGGGIAGVIYRHISDINVISENVDFKRAIDVTAGAGYVSVYLVSILLSYVCFNVKHSPYHTIKAYLRMVKTLFYVTVAFLSTTIAQLFLQYQWLSLFISNNEIDRVDIAFAYPLIMSVFYVGIVVFLFIPATEVLKRLLINRTSFRDEEITREKVSALFPKLSGAEGLIEAFKSFFLFTAPILTVIVAELVKIFFEQ